MKYNYGECEICDAKLVGKQIKQDFWIRGKLVVIDNVPGHFPPFQPISNIIENRRAKKNGSMENKRTLPPKFLSFL